LLSVSSLLLFFYRSLATPPTLESPGARYDAPTALEGKMHEFTDLAFSDLVFVRYTTILLVDIGVLNSLISCCFVASFF